MYPGEKKIKDTDDCYVSKAQIRAQQRHAAEAIKHITTRCGDCGTQHSIVEMHKCLFCAVLYCSDCAHHHFGPEQSSRWLYGLKLWWSRGATKLATLYLCGVCALLLVTSMSLLLCAIHAIIPVTLIVFLWSTAAAGDLRDLYRCVRSHGWIWGKLHFDGFRKGMQYPPGSLDTCLRELADEMDKEGNHAQAGHVRAIARDINKQSITA